MTLGRSTTETRLAKGWEHGFPPGPAQLLAAIGGGYRGLLEAREWLYHRRVLRSRALACPVISVGNLTLGGTGKTPAVELAVQTLCARGHRPAIVSRGYRRRSDGVQVVADAASIRLDAEDAGDEPFLLARRLPGVPVVVGSNRYEAAREAIDRFGVTAIVLDDGFQHRTLRKDLEIVMVRARNPWGNGRLLPGGPLREPLKALRRADLVVVTGAERTEDTSRVAATVATYAPAVPVLAAGYRPTECWEFDGMRPVELSGLAPKRLVAFAGIGSPVSFVETLASLGVRVEALIAFADHHWYTPRDFKALDERVRALGADGLITTEKDWVRFRRLAPPACPLYAVSVRLVLVSGADVWRAAFERTCSRG